MSYKIYLHGTPHGQTYIGGDDIKSWIESFYNHKESTGDFPYLEIEITKDFSLYTYIASRNLIGADGRSGAYFGISLKLEGQYCRSIENLYNLLEKIYHDFCLDTIISSRSKRYLVSKFPEARLQERLVYDAIYDFYKKYHPQLDIDELHGLNLPKGVKNFNINEVDSPIFFETLRNNRIRVSKYFPCCRIDYDKLHNELNLVKAENIDCHQNIDLLEREKNELNNTINRQQKEFNRYKEESDAQLTAAQKKYLKLEKDYNSLEKNKLHQIFEPILRNFDQGINLVSPPSYPTNRNGKRTKGGRHKNHREDNVINSITDSSVEKYTSKNYHLINLIIQLIIISLLLFTIGLGIRNCRGTQTIKQEINKMPIEDIR